MRHTSLPPCPRAVSCGRVAPSSANSAAPGRRRVWERPVRSALFAAALAGVVWGSPAPGRAQSITIPNPGFEAPAVGGGQFQYQPGGGTWTFNEGAGVSGNGSGFTGSNPSAPEGVQVGFIQGGFRISQTLSGFNSGVTYTVRFRAAQRNHGGSGQTWNVQIDGVVVGSFAPPASATDYAEYTATFTTSAGSHELAFQGSNLNGGDNTVLLDDVRITYDAPGGGLPSPWTSGDIGSVGQTGSTAHTNGTFTVKGSGADIWDQADAFHFAHQPWSGDGEIKARVVGFQNTDAWAKVGVMMRETLSADSKHALMTLSFSYGSSFQRRTATAGGSQDITPQDGAAAPYWVRLVRAGNILTGYRSSDGVTWVEVGSDTVAMNSAIYVGLAVTAHNNAALNTATFDNVSVTSSGSPASGTGLKGDYFSNQNLSGTPALTRTDATVDFDWGGGPADPSLPSDSFSVRWTGQVQPQFSETYTLYTTTDDGVRLWVNGVQLINDWTGHPPTENSGTIALTGGTKYDITMEYFEGGGGAVAKLQWSSASQAKQTIPQTRLYPATGGGGGGGSITVANASFETPAVADGAFEYFPSGGSWTFDSAAGVAANGSGFTSSNPSAPDGRQVAFLQGGGGVLQTVAGFTAGVTYTITFAAAQRSYEQAGETWSVKIDGTTVSNFAPPQSATAYVDYTCQFTATASSHAVEIRGSNLNGGDNTVLIDHVRITFGSGPTVPAAPSGLAAAAVSASQINLSWTDNAGNEDGFKIERKTGAGGTYAQVATAGANATSYQNSGLSAATTYFYRVRAHNSTGDSGYSSEVNATTQATGPSGTGLKGDYFVNNVLTLTRTDATVDFDWGGGAPDPSLPSDNFTVRWSGKVEPQFSETYTFYTMTDDGVRLWVNGAQLIDDWNGHPVTENSGSLALTAGQQYDLTMEYYEGAVDAVARLQWSSPSQARQTIPQARLYPASNPQPTPPAAPSGLAATAISSGQINLSWVDNANNENEFKIERKTGSGGSFAQVATAGANATSYVDVSVSASTTYYYRVRAANGAGDSPYSNEANATTPSGSGGSVAPYILSRGHDNILNLQITGASENWLLSDLSTRQLPSGYEWWYLVGGKIIKTTSNLTNEPWKGNHPGRVLKMGGKIGLGTFNQWSLDPNASGYFDYYAGVFFERGDTGGFTTFLFK